MNRPQQRRKSQLGRRYLNGQKPERLVLGQLALPCVTPNTKSGLGRSRALCLTGKTTSNDKATKKQLFAQSSSGKKTQLGSYSRAFNLSPNDSQGSYQSDHSLNVTGVQSIKSLSPDNISSSGNPFVVKPYEGYISKSDVGPPLVDKPLKWDIASSKPPPTPPPSRYDRLIQLELASMKPPVDPDDLLDLKNLTLDKSLQCHSYKNDSVPITSTAIKDIHLSKFSPHLSSTCLNSALASSSEKETIPPSKFLGTVLTEKAEITETSIQDSNKGIESCHDLKSLKSCDLYKNQSSSITNNNCYEPSTRSIQTHLDLENISPEKKVYSVEEQLQLSKPETGLDILNSNNESAEKSDINLYSRDEETNVVANKLRPVIRSLNFEFTKPLPISANASKGGKSDTIFLNETLGCTPSRELHESLSANSSSKSIDYLKTKSNLSLTLNDKPSASSKKLFSISEMTEDLSYDEMNSTDSFLLEEQTIIDQDQLVMGTETTKKTSSFFFNSNTTTSKAKESSDSEDELVQAMEKVDATINEIQNFRRQLKGLENGMKTVKTTLKKLKDKRRKSVNKESKNKENLPTREAKQMENKWFNEMKSGNPNLLKTPNPARQSVSRMSLANQSIMTPHSLSLVINDQIDDLFH